MTVSGECRCHARYAGVDNLVEFGLDGCVAGGESSSPSRWRSELLAQPVSRAAAVDTTNAAVSVWRGLVVGDVDVIWLPECVIWCWN